jgi:hypothetical protein
MKSRKDRLTIFQLLQNILAALIGIQSDAKVKEISEKITISQIILCGLILVGSFVATIVTVVYFVLPAHP